MFIDINNAFHFKMIAPDGVGFITEYKLPNLGYKKKFKGSIVFKKEIFLTTNNILTIIPIEESSSKAPNALSTNRNLLTGSLLKIHRKKKTIEPEQIFFLTKRPEKLRKEICLFNLHENLYNSSIDDWIKNYKSTEKMVLENYVGNFLKTWKEYDILSLVE
jgi:hypothetical protein